MRGTLRTYLGAAPGVGKTFTMLEEGRRRAERGADVVIGVVETHGRAETAAQIGDLEVVPRRFVEHRDASFTELDLDAVLRAADQIELVDMAPEALRRRMARGNIYRADKIDAALGNYFRLGNLTALRELALLWVADTGPGVPAADRERVFAPFQRLGDRPDGAGVGLGLAVARGFVEAMGGTLEPEDTPGGGLTMVISLPEATP